MPYIKELEIKDFQSHKVSKLEFSPGLNCIIGSSNQGKSSIIRALSFFIYGYPWKESFIRYGEQESSLSVILDTGNKISRIKGSKVNKYICGKEVYDSFGKDLPIEVVRQINMSEVAIDVDKTINLNVSYQLDPLFLLNENGTIKAKMLNKLSGLHIIDAVLRDLNKDIRDISNEKHQCELDIESMDQDLEIYKDLDTKLITAQQVQEGIIIVEEQQKVLDIRVDLYDLLCTNEGLTLELDKKKQVLNSINVDGLLNDLMTIEKEQIRLSDMELLYNLLLREKSLVNMAEDLKKIDIDVLVIEVRNIELNSLKLSELESLKSSMADIKESIKRCETSAETYKIGYNRYVSEYKEFLLDNKKCPICGNDITEGDVSRCLNQI